MAEFGTAVLLDYLGKEGRREAIVTDGGVSPARN